MDVTEVVSPRVANSVSTSSVTSSAALGAETTWRDLMTLGRLDVTAFMVGSLTALLQRDCCTSSR